MAIYDHRKVTHVSHEYRLPAPVAYGEFAKAYDAACEDYKAVTGRYATSDDAIKIRSDDESVTLYFPEPIVDNVWGARPGNRDAVADACRDLVNWLDQEDIAPLHVIGALQGHVNELYGTQSVNAGRDD